jgi:hypothetical protein
MSKKYWVALGEHSAFTKNDRYVLQILYSGQSGSAGYGLLPKFVEADDLESARRQLHAFIDERIDHELHMIKVEHIANKIHIKRENFKSKPKIADNKVDSISIGGFVNEDPKAASSSTEGLLNLDDLL